MITNLKVDKLTQIAQHAGKIIMQIYDDSDIGVEIKSDNSPVTKADLAANDYIVTELTKVHPEIEIISEEKTNKTGKIDKFFLVDPLDGTKSFIKKTGQFTVNIGYIEYGQAIAGVIYVPAQNVTYYSDGNNSYKIDANGNITQINCVRPEQTTIIVASASHRTAETDEYINNVDGKTELISAASSLKFCKVAEGAAHLYPRFGRTMEWDTAAGQAILQAAGGKVLTPNGEPFLYNKNDDWDNGWFIASCG